MNLNATILGQAISFFLFVFFCMRYIWPPIIFTINNRQKKISDSMLYIKDSKKKLESYQKKINDEIYITKKKAHEIISQAKYKRTLILKQANIQAQEEKKKILEKTQTEIKIAYQNLRHQLIKEISQISVSIAEKIIKNKINDEKTKHIIDNLIKKL
ncbi:MAG: F0F1 ATP synthase subunit B [Buchnera aphidicola (Meitanaphis elongallis)]